MYSSFYSLPKGFSELIYNLWWKKENKNKLQYSIAGKCLKLKDIIYILLKTESLDNAILELWLA